MRKRQSERWWLTPEEVAWREERKRQRAWEAGLSEVDRLINEILRETANHVETEEIRRILLAGVKP